MSDDIEDAEWDRWMTLSDAEMDAEVKSSMEEYNRWFNSMTPLQQWKHLVRSCSENLIRACRLESQMPWATFLKTHTAKIERRLKKLLNDVPTSAL